MITTTASRPLSEICHLITDGKHGDCENEENSGYYFISCKDVRDGRISYDGARQITKKDFDDTHRRTRLEARDILITNSGTIGRLAFVPDTKLTERTTFQKSVAIIKPNPNEVEPKYLYYVFAAQTNYLIELAGGTAQKNLLLSDLRRFRCLLHDERVQRKIAAILTAYDDLIEVNKHRIALLEKTAEELYREWFVRMRFPGHQGTRFVKGVPEGWEVKPINSFCAEIRAGVKKKDLADDEIYIGLEHIPRKSIAFKEWSTADSVDSNKLRFKERDILFSKIRPYLHKVALAHFSGACSSDTIVLRPHDRVYEGFLLFTVFSDTFIELATIAAKGTKMPRADWAFLEKLEIKIPPPELLETYQGRFEEIFALIATLLRANQQATESRDLLLPRLISGKLSVEDLDIQFPPSMREEAA